MKKLTGCVTGIKTEKDEYWYTSNLHLNGDKFKNKKFSKKDFNSALRNIKFKMWLYDISVILKKFKKLYYKTYKKWINR